VGCGTLLGNPDKGNRHAAQIGHFGRVLQKAGA
jgi:hypothetical protein